MRVGEVVGAWLNVRRRKDGPVAKPNNAVVTFNDGLEVTCRIEAQLEGRVLLTRPPHQAAIVTLDQIKRIDLLV